MIEPTSSDIYRITLPKKTKAMSILKKFGVVGDRMTYSLISDLHVQLAGVELFFSVFMTERKAMNRDNKRLLKIRKLVDDLETHNLKQQFLNQMPILQIYPEHKMNVPNSNEILQHVIIRCGALAQYLESSKIFPGKKKQMYLMLAEIVNALSPQSKYFSEPEICLLDGELKAFQKYLFQKES